MDTQTQIERLIELAIVQRTELKELVAQLPQLREHLSTEIEKAFDEAEPQLRAELEEWTTKQTADKTAALGVTLEAKIADLAKSLEVSTQARYNAIIAEREENARLAAQAEAKIAEHAASLPSAVKDIVTAELARFPRAGEIDQLRKEFAEPRGLNPRGKWQAGETYNKLDLVTINGDSYTSNTDGNRTRPSRSSADWTLVAARGTGGGGGPTSLSELTTVPSDGDVLIGSGTSWVTSNLTAGAGISITVGPGAITISATDGDITLDDGTAASPSLHFTNDPDTGIYRPAANTLGISTSGVQRMYVDENGITTVGAGGTFDGSVHAANGNANNPSFSFSGDQDTGFFRHQPNEIGIALGGTQYATLTSTTFSITPNVSTSGNLTVSGTGTSSVAGNLALNGATSYLAISPTTAVTNNVALQLSVDVADNRAIRMTNTASGGHAYDFIPGGGGDAGSLGLYDNTAGSYRLFIPSTGNLLIGTTIDSGNGKLQLATHTTSAGGIGFGTDTSWYRSQGGVLTLDTSANFQGFEAKKNGTLNFNFYSNSSDTFIGYKGTGSLTIQTLTGSPALTLDSSQNATFAGNLTVNGTGTSAIQGDTINLGAVGNVATVVNLFRNNASVGGMYAGNSDFNLFGGASAASHLVIKSNGNVLIGTTVDSSALLQVGTNTTTAAGGMKFGTDTSLYRSQTGMLALDGLTGSLSQLDLRVGGVQKAFVAWNGGDFYLGAVVGTTVIRSSNTTALTLDSSQNATFAGDVGLSGNEKYLNLFSTYIVGSNSRARLRAVGSGGGSGYGGSFTVDTRTSGNSFITALTIDDAQNATFAGSVKAASQVYAEKSGAGIAGQSVGLVTQFTTVNSTTYSVTTAAAKVFVVQLGSGDAALCYTSYKSSTITILGSDGTIVNSNSPSSTQLGIWKGANDHVIYFVTGSNALAGSYGSWGFCFLGNPVISIA
jgi:hypothetical protein